MTKHTCLNATTLNEKMKLPHPVWHIPSTTTTIIPSTSINGASFRFKSHFFLRHPVQFSPFSFLSTSSFLVCIFLFLPFTCPSFAAPFHPISNTTSAAATIDNVLDLAPTSTIGNHDNAVEVASSDVDGFNLVSQPINAAPFLVEGEQVKGQIEDGPLVVSKQHRPFYPDDEDDENEGDEEGGSGGEEDEDGHRGFEKDDAPAARVFARLLATKPPISWEQSANDGGENGNRAKRAVTQALCPIKQGKKKNGELKVDINVGDSFYSI